MKGIDEQIEELNAKLEELVAEKARLEELSPEKQLAIALHDSQCGWNHTDGCGWFYEMDNGDHLWSRYAHESWLRKARKVTKLLPDFSPEQIIDVANALSGL